MVKTKYILLLYCLNNFQKGFLVMHDGCFCTKINQFNILCDFKSFRVNFDRI